MTAKAEFLVDEREQRVFFTDSRGTSWFSFELLHDLHRRGPEFYENPRNGVPLLMEVALSVYRNHFGMEQPRP